MNCNVGKADRVIRVIVAIVLLWLGYQYIVNQILRWILYIIAVYLVITVVIGKCFVYKLLKMSTCKGKATPAAARPAPKPAAKKKKR